MSREEVIESLRDGQPPVDALVVETVLTQSRELPHVSEEPLLIRGQRAVTAQEGQDIGLVGGGVGNVVTHRRNGVSVD